MVTALCDYINVTRWSFSCYLENTTFCFNLFYFVLIPFQVLGIVRCPLYVMRDKRGGFPSFLRNNFVGNTKDQLLIGLEHAEILTQEEIEEVVHLSQC